MELLVVEGPDAGRRFQLGPQTVIGRDPTAAVSLDDVEVSRRHAIISFEDGRVSVEDLGSSNGTFVEGEQVRGEAQVSTGQWIRVGQTILELREARPAVDPDNLPSTKVPLPELGERPAPL
jgi:pSer/pThr/pTyr-binding forkhead associated (FHA) protein